MLQVILNFMLENKDLMDTTVITANFVLQPLKSFMREKLIMFQMQSEDPIPLFLCLIHICFL